MLSFFRVMKAQTLLGITDADNVRFDLPCGLKVDKVTIHRYGQDPESYAPAAFTAPGYTPGTHIV